MAKQHGGYENIGCLEKDIRNHLDKERRLALESGDANAMLEFFMHMQEKDPNFFYAMDLDDEHRLKNVFWVDGKGREDYQDFGDVVSFDTNIHHKQSTSTFSWLMQTWVRVKGGKPPSAIITDQDRAMKASIQLVFPDSRHRHCLWHILKKDQFGKRWQALVEKFDLMEDEWLQSLYEDREHEVFKKFQTEAFGVFGCHLMKEKEEGKIITFKVLDFEKNEDFIVEWDASMEEISCLCRSFEYNGFLCRHSLCTLHSLGVFNIPSRYILKWWTKDVRTKYKKGSACEELQSKKQRRDDLFDRATELIEENSLSLESYNIAHQAVQDALKRCSSVNHSLNLSNKDACGANESLDLGKKNFDCNILHEKKILDPKVSKRKGAPKRIKHGVEEKH
ncbi:Zinc finger, PMZ-type [Corchorus olitorius]|uniref:Protein FAR1-RELATED SEQUENCE n=1 Tax=Corchorus olitorius TaxID=93759 RepID=A0A1R3KN93_9ROSI|nr:Zinc finger, PMZ-type [Corchorus olitorius]